MKQNFTEEALALWNKIPEEDQVAWLSNVACQKCQATIDTSEFNGSMYEGQLALFHMCRECGNKEVRLIDIKQENQQAIDDDFERWKEQKKAANPGLFKDD